MRANLILKRIFFAAKHNVDLGLNISDELKDLKENLEAYRCHQQCHIFWPGHLLPCFGIFIVGHIISYQYSSCHDNGSRAAGAGDEFADVEVDEHIKPRNKAFLIYETSL